MFSTNIGNTLYQGIHINELWNVTKYIYLIKY